MNIIYVSIKLIKKYLLILPLFFHVFLFSQADTLIKLYNYQGKLIHEGHMINDKREGEWKFYNDSLGYLYRLENYKNDYPDGEFKEFNSLGTLILKGTYSNKAIKHTKKKNKELGGYVYSYKPLPVGELLYYDNKGRVVKKEFYNSKGKLLKIIK